MHQKSKITLRDYNLSDLLILPIGLLNLTRHHLIRRIYGLNNPSLFTQVEEVIKNIELKVPLNFSF